MDSSKSLAEIVDGFVPIKRAEFQVVIGIFFALAIISVLARAGARLHQRRRLGWDDYFLFAAAVVLAGAVGLLYHMSLRIYIWTAMRMDTSILSKLDPNDLQHVISSSVPVIDSWVTLTWTSIHLVKASFLAFFKQLIWQVSRIQRYYWAVVVLTVLSWMFAFAMPFILCSEFGLNAIKCMDSSRDVLYISLTAIVGALDIITDLGIISIPIILLRRSKLRLSQKLVLGVFLCGSLLMAAFSLIRVVKIQDVHGVGVDLPWEFFWQTMEANVAVLMGSLTVFRTLLNSESIKHAETRRRATAAGPRSQNQVPRTLKSFGMWRLLNIKGGSRLVRSDLESHAQDGAALPEIPKGTMTGIRSFIWGNRSKPAKDPQASAQTGTTLTVDDENYLVHKTIDSDKSERPSQAVSNIQDQQVPPNPDSWNSLSAEGATINGTGLSNEGHSVTSTQQAKEKQEV
ncbi:hypothetical protein QBC37DRAFT_378106 [Rhypophila decipiens]|uniref:Rhodopsin domain-containing protein n=1 Tax=Rhypophila decipiens TaxID=261697 RepID=A0AAN6Y3B9_9PEZI|nr:hypothetical protein QBC37DRAFT_378106 [Rhypophila decipiens]